MSVGNKLLGLLNFFDREQILGQCSFLSSFLSSSSSLDKKLIEYLSFLIAHGCAKKHHGGNGWSIRSPRGQRLPFPGSSLPSCPIFHSKTDLNISVLGTMDFGGSLWLHCSSPIHSLKDVRLSRLIAPGTKDASMIFHWGICPGNPGFASSRREKIHAIVKDALKSADCERGEREYFSGKKVGKWGTYIVLFHENTCGIALPQYFLDEDPSESDPVFLVEGDHAVLVDIVKCEDLLDRIEVGF